MFGQKQSRPSFYDPTSQSDFNRLKTQPFDNEMRLFPKEKKEHLEAWAKLDELPREDHFEPKFTPN